MTLEWLAAFYVFALVGSITPGPNIMLILASGVNFGFRRTIPHMLGITIGFSAMLGLTGIGIAQLFQAVPRSYDVLRAVSVIYLLWLAWKIGTGGPMNGSQDARAARPMTFLEAAAFQWVNPKAWTLCLTAVAGYALPSMFYPSLSAMMAVFTFANMPCLIIWTAFGVALRRVLSDPSCLRVFNIAMAVALVLSIWPLVADVWK